MFFCSCCCSFSSRCCSLGEMYNFILFILRALFLMDTLAGRMKAPGKREQTDNLRRNTQWAKLLSLCISYSPSTHNPSLFRVTLFTQQLVITAVFHKQPHNLLSHNNQLKRHHKSAAAAAGALCVLYWRSVSNFD